MNGFLDLARFQATHSDEAVALSCAEVNLLIVATELSYSFKSRFISSFLCAVVGGYLASKSPCKLVKSRWRFSLLQTATVLVQIKHVGFALARHGKIKQNASVHSGLNWRFSWSTFRILIRAMFTTQSFLLFSPFFLLSLLSHLSASRMRTQIT